MFNTPHTIESNDLYSWLNTYQWHTFASSYGKNENKSLQVQIGGDFVRVLNGKEIAYEGQHKERAVEIYNSIVGKPAKESEPKTDN